VRNREYPSARLPASHAGLRAIDALCSAFAVACAGIMTYPDATGYGLIVGFPGYHPGRDACSEDRTAHLAIRRGYGTSRSVVDAPSGRDQNVLQVADYERQSRSIEDVTLGTQIVTFWWIFAMTLSNLGDGERRSSMAGLPSSNFRDQSDCRREAFCWATQPELAIGMGADLGMAIALWSGIDCPQGDHVAKGAFPSESTRAGGPCTSRQVRSTWTAW
jgi:hypothetical protein